MITPEKLDLVLVAVGKKNRATVDVVVVDEAHNLGQSGAEERLELLLATNQS